jgi:hypothetical protein
VTAARAGVGPRPSFAEHESLGSTYGPTLPIAKGQLCSSHSPPSRPSLEARRRPKRKVGSAHVVDSRRRRRRLADRFHLASAANDEAPAAILDRAALVRSTKPYAEAKPGLGQEVANQAASRMSARRRDASRWDDEADREALLNYILPFTGTSDWFRWVAGSRSCGSRGFISDGVPKHHRWRFFRFISDGVSKHHRWRFSEFTSDGVSKHQRWRFVCFHRSIAREVPARVYPSVDLQAGRRPRRTPRSEERVGCAASFSR